MPKLASSLGKSGEIGRGRASRAGAPRSGSLNILACRGRAGRWRRRLGNQSSKFPVALCVWCVSTFFFSFFRVHSRERRRTTPGRRAKKVFGVCLSLYHHASASLPLLASCLTLRLYIYLFLYFSTGSVSYRSQFCLSPSSLSFMVGGVCFLSVSLSVTGTTSRVDYFVQCAGADHPLSV